MPEIFTQPKFAESASRELAPLLMQCTSLEPTDNSVGADGWIMHIGNEHLAALMPRTLDTYRQRFNATGACVLRKIFAAPYFETESYTVNVLPTTQALNVCSRQINGERHFTSAEIDGSLIPGSRFIKYLRQRKIPRATHDLNYIIHDRAPDDHLPGELVTPLQIVDFVSQAAARLDDSLRVNSSDRVLVAVDCLVAAFDFLTYSLTLYTWECLNGSEVSPPPPTGVTPIDRFSFENITGSLVQIAEAGHITLPQVLEVDAQSLVDSQAARFKSYVEIKSKHMHLA